MIQAAVRGWIGPLSKNLHRCSQGLVFHLFSSASWCGTSGTPRRPSAFSGFLLGESNVPTVIVPDQPGRSGAALNDLPKKGWKRPRSANRRCEFSEDYTNASCYSWRMVIFFERREQGEVWQIGTLSEALELAAAAQAVFWRVPGASDDTASWRELSAEWISPLRYLLAQPAIAS